MRKTACFYESGRNVDFARMVTELEQRAEQRLDKTDTSKASNERFMATEPARKSVTFLEKTTPWFLGMGYCRKTD